MSIFELIAVFVIISISGLFLLRNLWKKLKPSAAESCGGSCSCAVKPDLKKAGQC
jgi:hypothetical protein